MTLILSGTDGLSDVDGSAATPAIRGTDANTGIFFPAADTIAFSEGGVESMRIDSSGNVGIGTSSPSAKLSVSDGTTRIDLSPFGSTGYIGTQTNHPVGFITNNTERARIDSSGNLLVGTASSSVIVGLALNGIAVNKDLTVGGGLLLNSTNASGTSYFVGFGRNASICGAISSSATNSTTYATSSDYRLKEKVAPMSDALAKVQALKPVTYKWKADGSDGEGFIAHELQEVVPQCVTGEKDAVDAEGNPVYQGIDTSFLVATIVAAMQEQQTMIEGLKAKVAALEAKG